MLHSSSNQSFVCFVSLLSENFGHTSRILEHSAGLLGRQCSGHVVMAGHSHGQPTMIQKQQQHQWAVRARRLRRLPKSVWTTGTSIHPSAAGHRYVGQCHAVSVGCICSYWVHGSPDHRGFTVAAAEAAVSFLQLSANQSTC